MFKQILARISWVVCFSLQALIRLYQCAISPFFPSCCRFQPSCSHYAIEAISKHGVLKGITFGLKRIARCHPWHDGGDDPVPPRRI